MKNREEVLTALRKFFYSSEVDEAEKTAVWDILTALRGPDQQNADVKRATTAVIRWHVLEEALEDQHFGAVSCPDSARRAQLRIEITDSDDVDQHFRLHAQRAFEALHLGWTVDNDPAEPEKDIEF